MKKRIPLKPVLVIVTGIAVAVSLGYIPRLVARNQASESFTQAAIAGDAATSADLPMRLSIPALGIDAPVESVGLTPDGAMIAPQGPEGVTWFHGGAVPGKPGTAVIAGHSGWKDDAPAVFDDLYALRKGDKIFIENQKGLIAAFVVRRIRSYGKDENVPAVFASGDGLPHLNLITCAGSWDSVAGSHSRRLVIFADKE